MNNHVNDYISLNNISKLLNRKLNRNAQLRTNQHNLFTVSMVEILLKIGHRLIVVGHSTIPVCDSAIVCGVLLFVFCLIVFSCNIMINIEAIMSDLRSIIHS